MRPDASTIAHTSFKPKLKICGTSETTNGRSTKQRNFQKKKIKHVINREKPKPANARDSKIETGSFD